MKNKEIVDFYNLGAEIGRLERGIGKIEYERTKEIIMRYLPKEKHTIYDIGGGIGAYSKWLAELGHTVHLIDLSPQSIEYAKSMNEIYTHKINSLEVGDAREIKRPDDSADVVLLMGPMYHLTTLNERNKALKEANRVLKKGGLLFCAGITRYGNLLWSLSTYGVSNTILHESEFIEMISKEMKEGQHIRPEKYSNFIARSYFHLPKEFEGEINGAGFNILKTVSVEGPTWLTPQVDSLWEDEAHRKTLLSVAKMVEEDINIMVMSPHFLTIAEKE